MTNTILILKNAQLEEFRLSADSVESYFQWGPVVSLRTKSGAEYSVVNSVKDLDKALSESLFMIKPVVVIE